MTHTSHKQTTFSQHRPVRVHLAHAATRCTLPTLSSPADVQWLFMSAHASSPIIPLLTIMDFLVVSTQCNIVMQYVIACHWMSTFSPSPKMSKVKLDAPGWYIVAHIGDRHHLTSPSAHPVCCSGTKQLPCKPTRSNDEEPFCTTPTEMSDVCCITTPHPLSQALAADIHLSHLMFSQQGSVASRNGSRPAQMVC